MDSAVIDLPTASDVEAAAARIKPFVRRTPVLTCEALDRMAGAKLFFKCENLQRVGAFKYRGATNAVQSLSEEQAQRGVATHSSGNHAAALALAARKRGIAAHVVMPSNAPAIKRAAVAGYGARIIDCAPTLASREATLASVLAETGACPVHPYDDARVIAGQGTAALELLEDVPDLDALVAPVGGGGLASGTSLAAHGRNPRLRVFAAEPAAADDAFRSLASGSIVPSVDPRTVCDGLRTSLGKRGFAILREHLERIFTVEEEPIIQAMRLMWERMKILVEPSSAVPLAALLARPAPLEGKRVGIIVSGGNVDLERLPWQRS